MSATAITEDLTILGVATIISSVFPLVVGEFKYDPKNSEPQMKGASGAAVFSIVASLLSGYWIIGKCMGEKFMYGGVICFLAPAIIAVICFALILGKVFLWESRRDEKQPRAVLAHTLTLLGLHCLAFLMLGWSLKTYAMRKDNIRVIVDIGNIEKETHFEILDYYGNRIDPFSRYEKKGKEAGWSSNVDWYWDDYEFFGDKKKWALFSLSENQDKLPKIHSIRGGKYEEWKNIGVRPTREAMGGWTINPEKK
ncbi:MAG: hypothetical protein AAF558_13885 [Verrucomicrobiota bacterium]